MPSNLAHNTQHVDVVNFFFILVNFFFFGMMMDAKVGKRGEERRLCEQAYAHANRKCVDKINMYVLALDVCYLVT